MFWNASTLVSIFTTILYGVLFTLVVLSKPRTRLKEIFGLYLLTMVLWSISAFLTTSGLVRVLPWFRVWAASPILMMLAIFFFVQTLFGIRRKWAPLTFFYVVLAVIITAFTDGVIQSAFLDQAGVLHFEFGLLVGLVAVPGYFLIILSLVELVRGYYNTRDANHRNRIRYLVMGLSLIIISSVLNFTPLAKYPIDLVSNGLTAILIAYSILRHQLLDIRVVIRLGVLYSLTTAFFVIIYYLSISLVLNLTDLITGRQAFFVSILAGSMIVYVLSPLRNQAQTWIDRLFFREKYNSGLMLERLSSNVASVLDLNMITNMILEETTSTLHLKKAAFLLKRAASEDFFLTAQKGMASDESIRLGNSHPIVNWFSSHDQPLTRHDLIITPQFKALWGQEREELDRIEAELFIPLKVKGELVGIFALGSKRSDEIFSHDDQLTLATLSNQVAVTIENARLYTAEQHRREELGSLYEMARILVVSDDVETVLNNIAQHAIQNIHATFARILTMEKGGEFLCRTAYPIRDMGHDLGVGKIEPLSTKEYYQRAINLGKALVLDWDDPAFNENDHHDLFLDFAKSLCISPLLVGDEPIGLLVLGEARRTTRESFDPDKLKLVNAISDQAASALRRATLHEQLEESFVQTVLALAKAMDARDTYTQDHSQRMAAITEALCRKLDMDEEQIQAIHSAAALHDIGKIGVPDEILRKPGPLTSQEWDSMKRHPKIGADIVAPVIKLVHVAPIIIAHHEKFDGSGYPYGLKGDQIPLGARILAVVDAYIAITDERVYRKARSHKEAISELVKHSGSQFDPTVVDVFLKLVGDGSKHLAA
jgi:HD-GYP domain-containing protein (c-di-GMP phosphodiesterase class II)